MLLTPQNLNIFFTGLETRFSQAYDATPVVADKISTTFPVGTEAWISGWMGMVDKMREWVGPRITRQPGPQTYLVPIQNFELTQSIDQFKLQDDTYGIYNPTITNMGVQARKWPDYQLRDLLQNQGSQVGSRQLTLDGLTHFNTAHPISYWDASRGTFPNDYTGGGVVINGQTVGGQLSVTAFATVWQDMARRKTESGEPWGIVPNLAMSGTMMKLAFDVILQSQFMGSTQFQQLGGGTNPGPNAPFFGSTSTVTNAYADYLMFPELGGPQAVGGTTMDNVWYLMDTKKTIKPLSWLLRQAPDFTYRNNPQDPVVFDTHTFQLGSVARGAPAWGFPHFISRSSA